MKNELYPGIAFSPQATLTENIGAADTIIKVSDTSAFPEAPNLATIGIDEDGETILYTAKTAEALSGCQRGIEGTAKAWEAGEIIGRNFTAKDHNDMIENLAELEEAIENHKDDKSNPHGTQRPRWGHLPPDTRTQKAKSQTFQRQKTLSPFPAAVP